MKNFLHYAQKYKIQTTRKLIELGLKAIPSVFDKDYTYVLRLMEKLQPMAVRFDDLNENLMTIGQSFLPLMKKRDTNEAIGLLEFLIKNSEETPGASRAFVEAGLDMILPLAIKEPTEALQFFTFLAQTKALAPDQEDRLFTVGLKMIEVFAQNNPWEVKASIKALTQACSLNNREGYKGAVISAALNALPNVIIKAPAEADSIIKTIYEALDLNSANGPFFGRIKSLDHSDTLVVVSKPEGPYKDISFVTYNKSNEMFSPVFHKAFFKGTASEFLENAPNQDKEKAGAFARFASDICARPINQLPKLAEALCLRSLESKAERCAL